jgi:hypothetical protein
LHTGENRRRANEESKRNNQNQAAARNAYSHPDPRDLWHGGASSGLPWGGVSIKHVIERGKEREQTAIGSKGVNHHRGGVSDMGGGVGYDGGEGGGRGERQSKSWYWSPRGEGVAGGRANYSLGGPAFGGSSNDAGPVAEADWKKDAQNK